MNVAGPLNEAEVENVLPLFGSIEVPTLTDPLEELLAEAYMPYEEGEREASFLVERRRDLVQESEFPDQSMYVLDKQLEALRERLARIKYYLGGVDDLFPG